VQFIRQTLFGKKAEPEELHALKAYVALELILAAAQTRASEAFNSAVANLGMRVLSGEADETMGRQMEEAAATYSTRMLRIQEEHGALQTPAAGAEYYAAQHLVYGDHLLWARAQQIVYQSLADPSAVATLQDANEHLVADKRHADKVRAALVGYMGISRHELNQMMGEAATETHATL
jgi:hypothetical protein